MQYYKSHPHILAKLLTLKQSSVPGKSLNGSELIIKYTAFRKPTERALREAQAAKEANLDLNTYSGKLDRIFTNKQGELIITLVVKERLSGGSYAFRSFNLKKGELKELIVL